MQRRKRKLWSILTLGISEFILDFLILGIQATSIYKPRKIFLGEGVDLPESRQADQDSARLQAGMVLVPKIHRLFVSSTFLDMAEERDLLREQVFPKLEQLASQQGWTLQIIDLQWGISLDDSRRHDTISLCPAN